MLCARCSRVGFTQGAAQEIANNQGVDSVDELRILDDSRVENLCKVLRRPGGTDDNNNVNRGTMVSARAEDNLKLAVIFVKHRDRVSRAVPLDDITLASLLGLIKQRDAEAKRTEPTTLPKIDAKD